MAVIKLAPAAGIELDAVALPGGEAEGRAEADRQGDERAAKIYETIGVYFGYAIAFYAEFYKIKHVLVMGRVTSGEGGVILLKKAQEVLDTEFPALAKTLELHIPDESSRRVRPVGRCGFASENQIKGFFGRRLLPPAVFL